MLDDGSVVVSGMVCGSAQFETTTLEAGQRSAFLARYDSIGTLLWARTVDAEYALAATANGSFYAAGAASGKALLTRFAPDGSVTWSVNEAGSAFLHVSAGRDGAAYVTGSFNSGGTFGDATLSSRGSEDMFVAKYTASGAFVWVQTGGGGVQATLGQAADIGSAVIVDADAWVYITGRFAGQGYFGSKSMESEGSSDLFLFRYDAATGSPGTF